MQRRSLIRVAGLAAALTAVLALAGPAFARPAAPKLTAPADLATVPSLPSFAWSAVSGVDHYEFAIAADSGFGAPVLGGKDDAFQTRNVRASLPKAIPNGQYWWHVRSVAKSGVTSGWTKPRSFTLAWNAVPTPLKPDDGAAINYPTPTTLVWSPVAGAAQYRVLLASDPGLGSLVYARDTVTTQASRFTPEVQLAPGTYYWSVTPIDARGHAGVSSPVWSFTFGWPSATTTSVTDMDPTTEVYDPLFSWNRIPGAQSYELEINSTSDFSAGSKVCCDDTILGTSFAPDELLKDNRFYWRVRAKLGTTSGYAGVWNVGVPFDKTFDKEATGSVPAIKNLHMRDNVADVGTDVDGGTVGYQTQVPVVSWDPVPGASSYSVDVVLYQRAHLTAPVNGSIRVLFHGTTTPAAVYSDNQTATPKPQPFTTSGGVDVWVPQGHYDIEVGGVVNPAYSDLTGTGTGTCDWTALPEGYWKGNKTANTYWTPLGTNFVNVKPHPDPMSVANEGPSLSPYDRYCVRVRANQGGGDATNQDVYGDYATLTNAGQDWAFQFTGYPTPQACSPSCTGQNLGVNDFISPADGVTVTRTPLFTWKPVAKSYFVIVARDASFSNIVDYAFTQVPAYAPRSNSTTLRTYTDEETSYYWLVMPASNDDGSGVSSTVLQAPKRSFIKQSIPATLLEPATDAVVSTQPTFKWTRAEGAKEYVLQVSADPLFPNSGLLDNVTTDATSWTSEKTYPADAQLFWRVRANNANGTIGGLRWSATGTFNRRLGAPVLGTANAAQGDGLPTWAWTPVVGALSYDLDITLPDGRHTTFKNNYTTASDPTEMTGTGTFAWRVRANFPGGGLTSSTTAGPYSTTSTFVRTISQPIGVHTDRTSAGGVLLSWEAKPGAMSYKVQISNKEDFSNLIENIVVDATNFAPVLMRTEYQNGGQMFWRVAATDLKGTVGDFTPIQPFKLSTKMKISASAFLQRGKLSVVKVTVMSFDNKPVKAALVAVTGAGLKPIGARTNAKGVATVRVKAKKTGNVTFKATKSGFQPTTTTQTVR